MDILAGLPKTTEGYQYILLVTDSLSHWSEALPMKTQEPTKLHIYYIRKYLRAMGHPHVVKYHNAAVFEQIWLVVYILNR